MMIKTAEIVHTYGKRIWIESCPLTGARHVMVQHDAPDETPFCYATFHYDYRHTSNSGTMGDATRMAVALGATEPVEHKHMDIAAMIAASQDQEGGHARD